MNSFIDDYLQSPATAIASAQERCRNLTWASDIDDNMIYDVLASGEFRLLQSIMF